MLLIRARDDYEVVAVRFFWRWFDREGEGEVVEAALEPVSTEPPSATNDADEADEARSAEVAFLATLTPGEHGGRNLQFWAEAIDRGGRMARGPDPPKQLAPARRGFLRRLGLRRQ